MKWWKKIAITVEDRKVTIAASSYVAEGRVYLVLRKGLCKCSIQEWCETCQRSSEILRKEHGHAIEKNSSCSALQGWIWVHLHLSKWRFPNIDNFLGFSWLFFLLPADLLCSIHSPPLVKNSQCKTACLNALEVLTVRAQHFTQLFILPKWKAGFIRPKWKYRNLYWKFKTVSVV